MERWRITVEGLVQGVGFRPFVFRQAEQTGLVGFVCNAPGGVVIEAEGELQHLEAFFRQLHEAAPRQARVDSSDRSRIAPQGEENFRIEESGQGGRSTTLAGPDLATCGDCLREIFDPSNRRFQYPFTTCTQCGPRFSILRHLPFDRLCTTMGCFQMCEICLWEYENPINRRFHAQTNACPECGPRLQFWDAQGSPAAVEAEALPVAVAALRAGQIVAVKGLGGFHLLVDARSHAGVVRLRYRKHREAKPFGIMAPSLAWVQEQCEVSAEEERLLVSPEAPIVLLRRRKSGLLDTETAVAAAVAPDNPYLGVMLPSTPLHHLLLAELGFPVVATSGNRSDEPLCTEEQEAFERLSGIADRFLVHDRPIARHVDDSVVRVMAERPVLLRRARGYVPLPIAVPEALAPTLAVGGHQKNTVALSNGHQVFLSQHIGDLDSLSTAITFQQVIADFQTLQAVRPTQVARDAHPDYYSTRFADASGLPVVPVQHHHAHLLACMAENGIRGPVLGVCWDGTGYGTDGTIWGGEFLYVKGATLQRCAHLRTFSLPGGDRAALEPRRAALGVLFELDGQALFDRPDLPLLQDFAPDELRVLERMLVGRVQSPITSSVGRLFDAVSALLGLCQHSLFEGQAAMQLEFAAEEASSDESYPFSLREGRSESKCTVLDWGAMVRGILCDLDLQLPTSVIAVKFHNTLAEMIVAAATNVGEEQVILTGGCFQNRYLTERAVSRLRASGFRPYWHQQVPPNDGGIALGQTLAVALRDAKR